MLTLITHQAPAGARYLLQCFRQYRDAIAGRRSDGADDAAAVRALADACRQSDPRFASDLYAAADRYEQANETDSR